jgi:hypothetical protein
VELLSPRIPVLVLAHITDTSDAVRALTANAMSDAHRNVARNSPNTGLFRAADNRGGSQAACEGHR